MGTWRGGETMDMWGGGDLGLLHNQSIWWPPFEYICTAICLQYETSSDLFFMSVSRSAVAMINFSLKHEITTSRTASVWDCSVG